MTSTSHGLCWAGQVRLQKGSAGTAAERALAGSPLGPRSAEGNRLTQDLSPFQGQPSSKTDQLVGREGPASHPKQGQFLRLIPVPEHPMGYAEAFTRLLHTPLLPLPSCALPLVFYSRYLQGIPNTYPACQSPPQRLLLREANVTDAM